MDEPRHVTLSSGRIYISYNSNDIRFAEGVKTFFSSYGAEAFLAPRNMPPGNWLVSNRRAIEAAEVFFLVLSPTANQSAEVLNEVSFVLSGDHRTEIVILMTEEFKIKPSLASRLGGFHIIECFSRAFENAPEIALNKALEDIFSILGMEFVANGPPYRDLLPEFLAVTNNDKQLNNAIRYFNLYQIESASVIFETLCGRNAIARDYLAFCKFSPVLRISGSYEQAERLLSRDSAMGAFGRGEIGYQMGNISRTREDFQLAFKRFESDGRLVQDAFSQFLFGYLYLQGADWRRNWESDPRKATHWLTTSFNNGFVVAAMMLAKIYETGVGRVARDVEKSKRFFEIAAGHGIWSQN